MGYQRQASRVESRLNCMKPQFTAELARLRSVLEEPLRALDLVRLGEHNRSYSRSYADERFESFIQAEWPYYSRVLDWYRRNIPKGAAVLEIGTFIPVIPLLLTWEGYRVKTVEKLALYGDALNPMVGLLRAQGVDFCDADIMDPAFQPGQFDTVNLLAVVEHLLGSPKQLLLRIHGMLRPDGVIVFAVPNQARLVRRLGLFFGGISVQPDYADYFESTYPFSGHHREYTAAEVVHALKQTGFQISAFGSVRYPPSGGVAKRAITTVGNLLPASFHQTIFAVGRKA